MILEYIWRQSWNYDGELSIFGAKNDKQLELVVRLAKSFISNEVELKVELDPYLVSVVVEHVKLATLCYVLSHELLFLFPIQLLQCAGW